MDKQLAIIRGIGFGCRDVGRPVLFFSTYISEGAGALQIMGGKDAMDFISAYQPYDVKDMEGKPVWVECDGSIVKVVAPWGDR